MLQPPHTPKHRFASPLRAGQFSMGTVLILFILVLIVAGCSRYRFERSIADLEELPEDHRSPFWLTKFPYGRYDFWVRDTVMGELGENGQQVDYLKEDFLNSTILFFDEGVFLQVSPFDSKALGDTIHLNRIWWKGVYYFGFYRIQQDQLTLHYRSGNGFTNRFNRSGNFTITARIDSVQNSFTFAHFEAGSRAGISDKIPNQLSLDSLFAVQERYEARRAEMHLIWWRRDLQIAGFQVTDGKITPILSDGRVAFEQTF